MKPIQTNRTLKNHYQPARGNYFHLFPTPFFHGQINLNLKEVKEDMDRLIDKVRAREGDNELNNYTTYFDQEIREEAHNLSWYNSFVNQLKDTYIEFIRTQFENEVDNLTRHDIHFFSWLNRYDTEHSHAPHDHVNSLVSGTLYVDVNEDSTPIRFINPNHVAVFSHGTRNKEVPVEHTSQMVTQGSESGASQVEMAFFPHNGDFLLWPSYIMHYVPKTQLKDKPYTRYSISFNFNHKLDLGSYEYGDNMSYSFLREDSE